MLFEASHNLLFFFKNLGLLEFTPVPCSNLSPNLSHLHCKIVYNSAKLLWKVRPEIISASICFPKLTPPKKWASPPFQDKILEAATQNFFQFPLSSFLFSASSFTKLPFSLPVLPSPSLPQPIRLIEVFHEVSIRELVFFFSRNEQHKVGILLSYHLPVLIKKKPKTFKNRKMKGKWIMFPTRSQN